MGNRRRTVEVMFFSESRGAAGGFTQKHGRSGNDGDYFFDDLVDFGFGKGADFSLNNIRVYSKKPIGSDKRRVYWQTSV